MSKKIEIVIGTEGQVSAEALGFQGVGCAKAVDELIGGLSQQQQETKKPEFHEKETQARLTQRG